MAHRAFLLLPSLLLACARQPQSADRSFPAPGAPAPPPLSWVGLLGEYDTPAGMRVVYEDGGRLMLADTLQHSVTLDAVEGSENKEFSVPRDSMRVVSGVDAARIRFDREANGRATRAIAGSTLLPRRLIEPQAGTNQLLITPVRPVAQVRSEALVASPPHEADSFRAPELVELTSLDPSIRLEVRYASTNNFLGTRFYDEARAFAQRPAAEAVVRAHRALRAQGFGLLIHDAYRPWYVTKMFWEATPEDKRWLVANPASGSKHNRGAAIDLTLFDLSTAKPVEMPSTYDESTDRAFADYPGGTSRQRWHRAVLRRAMEAEGFVANPSEWWHFDYKDWRQYAIGNVAFDRIAPALSAPALSAPAASSPSVGQPRRLKVFISVDMEGLAGVVTSAHVSSTGNGDYQYFRKIMAAETNAAIDGAMRAGATDIVVRDGHGSKENLLPDDVDPRARLLRGVSTGAKNMMEGIDSTFDAVVFVGYHAKAGTPAAILEHTSNGNVIDLSINGVSLPEGGYNALVAGLYGVPVVFVAGDRAVVDQIRGLLGPIEGVAVKEEINDASNGMSPKTAQDAIRSGVEGAVRTRARARVYRLSPPYTMSLRVKQDGKTFPGATKPRAGEFTFQSADLLKVLEAFNMLK